MSEIDIFVSCPFEQLVKKYLDLFLEYRLNPEIGLNAGVLDRFTELDFEKTLNVLSKNGLKYNFHAPFSDLPLGSLESSVRNAVIDRLSYTIKLASKFDVNYVVFHTGYESYLHDWLGDMWLNNLEDSIMKLSTLAQEMNVRINVENVFEKRPQLLKRVLDKNKYDSLGFCLDVGHVRVFSNADVLTWLISLKDRLRQIHLHDNFGREDDHLHIGEGNNNFNPLFEFLKREKLLPAITLEVRSEGKVLESISKIKSLLT